MKHFHIQICKKVLIGLFAVITLCALATGALLLAPNSLSEGAPIGAHAETYKPYLDREAEEVPDGTYTQEPDNSTVKISAVIEAEPLKVAVYYFNDLNEGWTYLLDKLSSSEATPIEVQLLKETTVTSALTTTVETHSTKNIVIDLNGQKLKSESGPVLELSDGSVTLTDSKETGELTATHASNGVGVSLKSDSKATFTLAGGTITGCTQGAISASGTASKVYIKGGKISGNTGTVAAVRLQGNTIAEMTGGEISGNTNTASSAQGGGVYINGDAALFTMKGGEISGNKTTGTSNGGGGVYLAAGTFTMESGVIGGDTPEKSNTAINGGGIYVAKGTLNLNGGKITGNVAQATETRWAYGGGVYLTGGNSNLTMASSEGIEISSNVAENEETVQNAQGGGMYLASVGVVRMLGGKVIKNTAYSGGGIYIASGNDIQLKGITIGGSEGDANTATAEVADTAYNAGGGGLFIAGSKVEIADGTVISYNKAEKALGGGIMATSGFTMSGGAVSYNKANRGGGVATTFPSGGSNLIYMTMTGGEISDNTAEDSGGGVYGWHGGIDLDGGKLVHNTVSGGKAVEETSGNGGGIYVAASSSYASYYRIILKSGEISQNSAPNGFGGGVYVSTSGTSSYGMDSVVQRGLCLPSDADKTLTVAENTARSGGGLYVMGPVMFSTDGNSADDADTWATFSKNTATNGDGGAIYATGLLRFVNSSRNTSTTNPYNIVFDQNTASGNGGAIFTTSGGEVWANAAVTFTSNEAQSGNGGAWSMNGGMTVYGAVHFGTEGSGNTAALNGGGFYSSVAVSSVSFTVSSSGTADFISNTADGDGGGIYAGGTITMTSGSPTLTVKKNVAGGNGGGVYVGGNYFNAASQQATLDVQDNKAATAGGIFLGERTSFSIGGVVHILNNKKDGEKPSDVYLYSRNRVSVGTSLTGYNYGAIYVGANLTDGSRVGIDYTPSAENNPNGVVIKYSGYKLNDVVLLHERFFADDEEAFPCLHPNLTPASGEIDTIVLSSEHGFSDPMYTWTVTEARKTATVDIKQDCSLGCGKTYTKAGVSASYSTSEEATCEEAGHDDYTAEVTVFNVAKKAEETVTITYQAVTDALGHKWEWTDDHHSLKCGQCHTEDASEKGEVALIDSTKGEETITVYETLEEAWTQATSIIASNEGDVVLFLLKGVTIESMLELKDEYDYVTLDLNGKRLAGIGGDMFTVSGQAHFIVDDTSAEGGGEIAHGRYGINISATIGYVTLKKGTITGMTTGVVMAGTSSTFTMTGGEISSCSNGVVVNGGTFTFRDGKITGNSNMVHGSSSSDRQSQGGAGVRLSGSATKFEMTGGEISNNSVYWGGGGLEIVSASAIISGGKIFGNTAVRFGAGIYVYSSGTLTLSGSAVIGGDTEDEGNKIVPSTDGGELNSTDGNGGGIFIESSTVTILGNAKIAHNTAYSGGGIYYLSGTLNFSGGEIAHNTAYQGGGMYIANSGMHFEATKSDAIQIHDNHAVKTKSGGLGNGGGVYTEQATDFVALTVKNNTAANDGGGIYTTAASHYRSGIVVESNSANNNGGGLYALNTINLYGGMFRRNTATYTEDNGLGGGMYINGNLSVYGHAVFEANEANMGGGMYVQGTFTMQSAYDDPEPFAFTGNTARKQGGGFYANGAITLSTRSTTPAEFKFTRNTASLGGGLYANNSATAITLNDGYSTATLKLTFEENTAKNSGGGLYAVGAVVVNKLVELTAMNNTASSEGGGMFFGGDLTVSGVTGQTVGLTVTGNKVNSTDGKGGGIRVTGRILFDNAKVIIQDNTDGDTEQNDLYLECPSIHATSTSSTDLQRTSNIVIVTEKIVAGSRIGIYLVPVAANGDRRDVFAYCSDDSFLGGSVVAEIFFSDLTKNGQQGQECIYEETASKLYYMTRHAYAEDPDYEWSDDHTSVTATLKCLHCTAEDGTLTATGTKDGGQIVVVETKGDCTTDTVTTYTATLTLGTGIYENEYTKTEIVTTLALGHNYIFDADAHTVKCTVCDHLATADGMTVAVEFKGVIAVFENFTQAAWNEAMNKNSADDAVVTVYILANLTPQIATFNILANVHVCVDLNGFTVKGFNANLAVFSVTGGDAVFTLTDTSESKEGKIINSRGVFMADGANGSKFIFNGGTLCDSAFAVEIAKGTFIMNEGAMITTITGSSGAVYMHAADASFLMNGGLITGNTTSGVYVTGGNFTMAGGKITNNGNPNIAYGGGVNFSSAQNVFTMTGGEISGNTATGSSNGYGGGVYCVGTFILRGGTIKENTARYGGGIAINGDIVRTNLLEWGDITNNTATVYGGGVYLGGPSASTFGGAERKMNISGNHVVVPEETLGASYTFGGAGMYVTGQKATILKNTLIENNDSNCSGGGVYVAGGTFAMSDGQIVTNTASRHGGGMAIGGGTVDISGGEIARNTVKGEAGAYGYGGGVWQQSGTMTISSSNGDVDTLITENTALLGGGIYSANRITLQNGVKVTNNTADSGGGMYFNYTSSYESDHMLEFRRDDGFEYVEISSNKANRDGGGLYIVDGWVRISPSEAVGEVVLFTMNTSQVSGGGIYAETGATIDVQGRIDITSNGSKTGGGMYTKGLLQLTDTGEMNFTTNHANLGGGMLVNGGGNNNRYTTGKMTFDGNIGYQNGGAILARSQVTFGSVTGTATKGEFVFRNNEARTKLDEELDSDYKEQGNGGAIYTNANITFIGKTVFESNSAQNDGGAFYQAGGAITFDDYSDTTFRSNTAKDNGGAIAGDGAGVIKFAGPIVFDGNTADGNGGAIYSDGNLTFSYNNGSYSTLARTYTVQNNTAKKSGGGIYSKGIITVDANKTLVLTGNQADGDGGAIYSDNVTPLINGNLTVTDNAAKGNGGGIYSTAGFTVNHNSANLTVTGNRAETKGGGVYVKQVLSLRGTVTVMDNKQGTEEEHTASNVYVSVETGADLPNYYGMIRVEGKLVASSKIYVSFAPTPEANPSNEFLYGIQSYLTSTEIVRQNFFADDAETYNCIYYDPTTSRAYMSSHVYAPKDNGNWSADFKSVTVTILCTHIGCEAGGEKSTSDITSEGGADCTTENDRTYSATVEFLGQFYTVTIVNHEYALGHHWVWDTENSTIYCTTCNTKAVNEGYLAYVYTGIDESSGFIGVYVDFPAAWAAALAEDTSTTSYATIVLLDNISLTASQVLAAGKCVRVDLNGKTITGVTGLTMFNIQGGYFVLDDRIGGGTLQVGRYAVYFNANDGHFTLTNGTIGSAASGDANNFESAVRTNNSSYTGCDVYIDGGTIQNCTNFGIYLDGNNFSIALNGGEIKNSVGGVRFGGSGGTLTVGAVKISQNTSSGIYVTGTNAVTIKEGAEITGNRAANGGGVYVSGSVKLNINGGSITGNSATSNGGGIYAGSGAQVSINGADVRIGGNNANMGGGIYMTNAGTSFDLTQGLIGGEGEENGNKGTLLGGGLYVSGGLVHIDGGKIQYNAAVSMGSGNSNGHGGGIYSSGGTVNISGGVIAHNSAVQNGGGIYAYGGSLEFLSEASGSSAPSGELSYNIANATTGSNNSNGGGGVFATNGATVVLSCYNYLFNGNVSKSFGGAIMIHSGTLTARGTTKFTFSQNRAENGDGGAIFTRGQFNVEGATVTLIFTENAAQTNGGAVSSTSVMTVDGGAIEASKNTAGSNGGAIHITNKLTLKGAANLTISENTSTQASGGGMYLANLSVESNQVKVTVSGNKAGRDGGGIYFYTGFTYDPALYGTDERSSFTVENNTAGTQESDGGNGGGIYFNFPVKVSLTLTVSQNTAKRNTASLNGNGGGIYVTGRSGVVFDFAGTSVIINKNTAEGSGGGIYVGGSGLTLQLSGGITVSDNTAESGDGGGIYTVVQAAHESGELNVSGNKAGRDGGGIYAENRFTAAAKMTVIENSAANMGGGLVCKRDLCIQGYVLIKGNTSTGGRSQFRQ